MGAIRGKRIGFLSSHCYNKFRHSTYSLSIDILQKTYWKIHRRELPTSSPLTLSLLCMRNFFKHSCFVLGFGKTTSGCCLLCFHPASSTRGMVASTRFPKQHTDSVLVWSLSKPCSVKPETTYTLFVDTAYRSANLLPLAILNSEV